MEMNPTAKWCYSIYLHFTCTWSTLLTVRLSTHHFQGWYSNKGSCHELIYITISTSRDGLEIGHCGKNWWEVVVVTWRTHSGVIFQDSVILLSGTRLKVILTEIALQQSATIWSGGTSILPLWRKERFQELSDKRVGKCTPVQENLLPLKIFGILYMANKKDASVMSVTVLSVTALLFCTNYGTALKSLIYL